MSTTPLAPPVLPYPLATKSREVVPHEVTAPAGCYRIPVAASGVFVLPVLPKVPLIAISTPEPLLAVFSNDYTLGDEQSTDLLGGALFCAPGTTMSYRPPDLALHLINESTKEIVVYVQLLNSWNILGTDSQLTRV